MTTPEEICTFGSRLALLLALNHRLAAIDPEAAYPDSLLENLTSDEQTHWIEILRSDYKELTK